MKGPIELCFVLILTTLWSKSIGLFLPLQVYCTLIESLSNILNDPLLFVQLYYVISAVDKA